ncbi:MAG: hypothetical protein WD294_10465 [Phycisphaeraceae bacterium]
MDCIQRHSVAVVIMLLSAWVTIASPATAAAAERVEFKDPPVVVVQQGKQRLRGQVIAWEGDAFELLQEDGEVVEVRWAELASRQVASVHARILGRDSTAEDQLTLARRLSLIDDRHAEGLMRQAIRRAVRMEASLAEQGKQIIAGRITRLEGDDSDAGDGGDTVAAAAQSEFTEEEHAATIEELLAFAEAGAKKIEVDLQLYKSEYFLFCTDLPSDEAEQWHGLLDRMYAMLLKEFDLPAGTNIWRGKAIVFMFESGDDYQNFQRTVHQVDPGSSAGMCHSFSSGKVHIALYKHSDDRHTVAHTLVHEATHGFVFRYRKQRPVVSWINEGLAEWAAYAIVPNLERLQRSQRQAENELQSRGSLEEYFEASHIEAWQYGVAYTMTEFLIRHNSAGYVKFFQAIKDGKPWREALEEDYGTTFERLVAVYGREMGVPDLKP